MSFSNDVRNELARIIPEKRCCHRAELSALLVTNARLSEAGKELLLKVETENAATARKIFKLLKENYQLPSSVRMEYRKSFKKNRVYVVSTNVKQEELSIFKELLIIDDENRIRRQVPADLTSRNCCRRAYLRGIFLSKGFVSRPEGNYHLEITLNDSKLAGDVQKIAAKFDLEIRSVERKNNIVLYIKESEKIADFLRLVGANKALLDFENVRIIKSMRNNVNRQVNCETANLAKTINASVRQIELIERLKTEKGLESLPPQLWELAVLRIEYPDLTLKELGEMLTPALSKSGVAYRMRRLESLVEEMLEG